MTWHPEHREWPGGVVSHAGRVLNEHNPQYPIYKRYYGGEQER